MDIFFPQHNVNHWIYEKKKMKSIGIACTVWKIKYSHINKKKNKRFQQFRHICGNMIWEYILKSKN